PGGPGRWVRRDAGVQPVGGPRAGGGAAGARRRPGMTAQQGMTFPGAGGPGGSSAWLAVIDMQRAFAEPDSPWLAPRFAEIVGPVKSLVEAFRPRVTFTR